VALADIAHVRAAHLADLRPPEPGTTTARASVERRSTSALACAGSKGRELHVAAVHDFVGDGCPQEADGEPTPGIRRHASPCGCRASRRRGWHCSGAAPPKAIIRVLGDRLAALDGRARAPHSPSSRQPSRRCRRPRCRSALLRHADLGVDGGAGLGDVERDASGREGRGSMRPITTSASSPSPWRRRGRSRRARSEAALSGPTAMRPS